MSLDEAYLDVTENLKGVASATGIAKEIRAAIRAETGLTASAGVSYNKFLAKLASDEKKPDGLFVITPEMGPRFIETLPIGKFHGIGPATSAKMTRLGIHTGLELRACELPFLMKAFGKAGRFYYWIARGIDERPVRANRIRKSIGTETTFLQDLTSFEAMRDVLEDLAAKVWQPLRGDKDARPNHHAESQIFRFRDHNPQPHSSGYYRVRARPRQALAWGFSRRSCRLERASAFWA